MWNASLPAGGTAAELYLNNRGIKLPFPVAIRFLEKPKSMLVAVHSPEGKLVAVQWTLLDENGQKLKTDIVRRTFGKVGSGAVRLAVPGSTLGLTEGVEDALAVTQITGVPCWAVLGARRLPSVAIPAAVSDVLIFADADETGVVQARKAAETFAKRGARATIRYPPLGHKDWGDVVQVQRQRAA
jgi:phage/plasmid primase-like uncharacterized protein